MKRNGSALLIVLGVLSFLVVSAVTFSAFMRRARQPSSYLRRVVSSRQLAKAAVARAIDEIDQAIADGTWRKLGEFDLAPGATLKLLPAKSKGYVVADGFAVVPAGCLRTGVSTIKNTNQL